MRPATSMANARRYTYSPRCLKIRTRPGKGNRRSGEVEGVSARINDDLHHVWVVDIGRPDEQRPECAHDKGRVLIERFDRCVDGRRLDQRLVTLHVDDEIAVQVSGNLGDPVGAAQVMRSRHADDSAERLNHVRDPSIIGGDHDRSYAPCGRGAAVDVFDHGSPSDVGKRLARESRGVESSGYDGHRMLCLDRSLERIRGRDRVHGES